MAYSNWLFPSLLLLVLTGCYAPLHSPGIPANSLPDAYRVPVKACRADLNYAMLTRDVPSVYHLGAGDLIKVEIADLVPRVKRVPPAGGNQNGQGPYTHVVDTHIDERGQVLLPLVGSVHVGDKTLDQARQQVVAAYAKGFLDNPKVAISVVQKALTRVMVIGQVAKPGVYELPRFENDVAHAITAAGGLIEENADEIQVHRRGELFGHAPFQRCSAEVPVTSSFTNSTGCEHLPPYEQQATIGVPVPFEPPKMLPAPSPQHTLNLEPPLTVLRIPLRSNPPVMLSPDQVTLNDGDVVVVRKLPDEAFFVVGKLSTNNLVRFTLGRENRDLGNGFVLPKDRDIDVVMAVAMAGYIDPIDSPTTVTVHRTLPNGSPMLIRVDLIAARFDRKENIMVRGGDIIYLNPDAPWWFRRTFDRIVPDLITTPYSELMQRWINPRGN